MAENSTDSSEGMKKALSGKVPIIAAVGALVVSALVVAFLWTQSPEYQVLFTGLSASDSGGVIEKLREKNIPYRVDGGAISVPAESVYEVRMELAGEGLPQGGGVGFEIFDNTGFGVTDFVQKVNYRRALQGELSRTISQIREVDSARVHLAIPEKGVFLDDKEQARASIVLKLRAGARLNPSQVSSIVNLVAGSVDNLSTDAVTVVDTTGKMWTSSGDEEGFVAMSSSQLEYKRSVERDLEQRIESMLSRTVGEGKVVARVSADLDSTHVERTEERYDPDGQVVRSEQINKESTVGAGAGASGVPGVMSNMAGSDGGGRTGSTPSQSTSKNETINYEISKTVSRVVEPVGKVERLTVAVLVDGTYAASGEAAENDGAPREFVPRTEDELARFTEMVKAAVGYSDERGDEVTVTSAPFEASMAPVPAGGTEETSSLPIPPQYIPTIIKYLSGALVALFTMLFVVRPIIKRLVAEKTSMERIESAIAEAQIKGEPALESGSAGGGGGGAGGAIPSAEEQVQGDETIWNIKKLASENPQQVAVILKSWLRER